ncbi:hypothetical protein ACSBR2_038980 [Camellia fascicularis]
MGFDRGLHHQLPDISSSLTLLFNYIAKTLYGDDDDDEEVTSQNSGTVEEPKFLGLYPGSNEKILLKNGPYGFYVQLGEDRKGYLPKGASFCA